MMRYLFLLFLWLYTVSGVAQSVVHGKQFQEMADPDIALYSGWNKVQSGLHVSFVTIDKRFPKHQVPDIKVQNQQTVRGWKGERVSAQVLLWTNKPAADVSVDVGRFYAKKDTLEAEIAQARFERYVMTDEFASGCGRRNSVDFDSSLSADMLDDLDSYNIQGNSVRPVWISIDIPRDAQPGSYRSVLYVKIAGKITQKLHLRLDVLNHTLPQPEDWAFHLDMWQNPSAVARVNNVKLWSFAYFQTMRPIMERLKNAGQKVITATLNKDPWNVQTYDRYEDMIIWTHKKDGSWAYDYTVFDRWVSFMLDIGIDKMINCYSLIPWNNEIHYKEEGSDDFIDVQAKPGTENFVKYWTPFLKDFVQHLRQKGWLHITNIALDERSPKQMKATFDLLDKVAPELGVSYADNHRTYKKFPNSKDVSIAADHPFDRNDLEKRTKKGLNTTFYIYCGNEFINTFTFSPPAEATYAGWYAAANGFNGMLRWSYNSWTKNPLRDSRFRTWPAGDTYIVYPQNRSSIRFERLREGIQDYEKIRIIKKQFKEQGRQKDLNKLETAIQKLKSPTRTSNWNQDLNNAKELLNSF